MFSVRQTMRQYLYLLVTLTARTSTLGAVVAPNKGSGHSVLTEILHFNYIYITVVWEIKYGFTYTRGFGPGRISTIYITEIIYNVMTRRSYKCRICININESLLKVSKKTSLCLRSNVGDVSFHFSTPA
jgi:hypothetical protein